MVILSLGSIDTTLYAYLVPFPLQIKDACRDYDNCPQTARKQGTNSLFEISLKMIDLPGVFVVRKATYTAQYSIWGDFSRPNDSNDQE